MTSQCEIEAWEEGNEPDYAFKLPSSIYSGFLEIKTNPEVLVEAFCGGYSGTGMLERRVQLLAFLKSLTAGTDVMTQSFTTKSLSMPEEIARIRQLFTFFGASYPSEPPSRDYFYDYLVSECSLLAAHADFLNWIVPSEGLFIANMRVFSRKESLSWTRHLQCAGFDGILFIADKLSTYSIGLRSNYDSKKLEAAYINSQSVAGLKQAKWHPDVQSLIYNSATGDSDALDFFATHMGGREEADESWNAFQTTISS